MFKKVSLWLAGALAIAIAVIKFLMGRTDALKRELSRREAELEAKDKTQEMLEEARNAETKNIAEIANIRDSYKLADRANKLLFAKKSRKDVDRTKTRATRK